MDGWCTCKKPPLPFIRVEIKDKMGRLYLGYYALRDLWLTTEGHYPIKYPEYWRWIPRESFLDNDFRRRIRDRLVGVACQIMSRLSVMH